VLVGPSGCGKTTLVTLDYRRERLVVRVAGDCSIGPGSPVWVRLPPERLLFFDPVEGTRVAVPIEE